MPWSFEIAYLPGKTNNAADATSRHPSAHLDSSSGSAGTEDTTIASADCNAHYFTKILSEPDEVEFALIASIRSDIADFACLSWEMIASETSKDPTMNRVRRIVEEGFHDEHRATDANVSAFWPYRQSLHVLDGVILYLDRAVIPLSLRNTVLQTLHSAHQCVSGMESRARAIVFWPGMTKDIQSTRDNCSLCNQNAPSQPATPPITTPLPSTPFEQIFADFFNFGGNHYLLAGDRLSGWVEIFKAPRATSLAGAGLIRALRTLFATCGVPEELSSDGGAEF